VGAIGSSGFRAFVWSAFESDPLGRNKWQGHQASAIDTAALTMEWIGNRFAGVAVRSDCGKF
jgi:hypothetical protein